MRLKVAVARHAAIGGDAPFPREISANTKERTGMSLARVPALFILALASLAGPFAFAQTAPAIPAKVLRQALIEADLCRPTDICTPTAALLTQLSERAKATEQWQPVPSVVTPGQGAAPPSDAIVLFDGRTLDAWRGANDHRAARWTIADGLLVPDKTAGNIETRRRFRNYQLHIEWRVPEGITGEGQARGNSGLFLASTGPGDAGYELQILDSWNNPTYVNGQAASIYKQTPPLVNAALPPGRWQSYDVIWTAPRFKASGALLRPAYLTVLHNGVLVQDHTALKGETLFIGKPFYRSYGRAPIKLQAHPDPSLPISFRNIWVRDLPD